MSFLSGLGLGAASAAGDILSQFTNTAFQKDLAKYQAKLNYKYAEKSARNTPTWNRAGLEKANYNPMLAVQNATSGANSSWTSSQSVNGVDYSDAVSTGLANARDQQRVENETKTADSTRQLNEANAIKAHSETITNAFKLPWIDKREKAEIANIEKGTAKMQSEINNIDKTTEYIDKYYTLEKEMQDIIKRGQDLSFAGFKYSADKGYSSSVYNANTYKDIADKHSPSGKSESFKNYASGIGSILGGAGSILNPFKGKFDSPFDIDEHTYTYDRHGNRSGERHTQRNYRR